MENKEEAPSWRPMKLDEDAHFFDFIAFYKKVEFCDRSIQLEILEEYRKVHGTRSDEDTEVGVADLDKTGGPSASVVPEDRGRASGESANLLKEANEGSEKDSEAGPRDLEEATRTAQGAGSENNQKKGEEEEGGKEAPMEEAAGSKSSEKQPGEKEEPSADGEKTRGTGRNERESPEERPAPSKEEVAWVEEIPVNSIVLAAKSCVLRTMLSNGMKESDKSAPVVLKVTPEEKLAFKELLHFVYVGTLSPAFLQPDASIRALVDLLIVGDKFEVGSLMGAVLSALFKRKQTVADDVVLALKIPDALEQYPEVKALIMEARARVVETFKDVDTWPASLEFLTLGQDVVSFLLQSEELEATTEEEIFKAVLVWVKNNYTERVARQQAMSRLSQHIRFGCIRGGVSGSDRAPSFRDGPSGDPRAGHVGDILPGVFRQCKAEVEGPFWPDQEGSSKPKPAGLLQLHDGRSRCFKEFPKGSLEGQAMGHSIAEGSQGKPPHCWLILGTKQTAQQGGRNHTNQMRVQVLCTGVATWLLESSKGFPVLFCRLPKAGVDFQMS